MTIPECVLFEVCKITNRYRILNSWIWNTETFLILPWNVARWYTKSEKEMKINNFGINKCNKLCSRLRQNLYILWIFMYILVKCRYSSIYIIILSVVILSRSDMYSYVKNVYFYSSVLWKHYYLLYSFKYSLIINSLFNISRTVKYREGIDKIYNLLHLNVVQKFMQFSTANFKTIAYWSVNISFISWIHQNWIGLS